MNLQRIQEKVQEFAKKNKLDSPPEFRVLDLVSEIGEVSKEVLKMTNYGTKPLQKNNEVKSELGDVLYSLITLANKLDINLEEALDLVLEKYQKRLKKGSAGSEVEEK
ncbi:MAG: MazG-like family protein [Patescibacteria group bacterium]